MEENSIIAKNLTKIFPLSTQRGFSQLLKKTSTNSNVNFKALDDVSFTLSKGEILGILGLNGSGKTTLLRILAGIYKPTSGQVTVSGRLAPLIHLGSGFIGDLAAKENIIMYGMLLGLKKSEIAKKVDDIIEYAELQKFSNMQLKHFSSGMRARLGFATAMQINPDILLLDEVLSVGDKIFRQKSFELFLSFKKNKKTILFTTHNLDLISKHSDQILLLDKGKKIMLGSPDEVMEKYKDMSSQNNS